MKNRLRVLRAERNWSQAELANEVGVSRQTINALEIQKYDPSLPLAYKIARLFDRRVAPGRAGGVEVKLNVRGWPPRFGADCFWGCVPLR
jgi:putative transcriptional regulator